MPKSRVRKKTVYTPPAEVMPSAATREKRKGSSPTWYVVLMVAVLIVGLVYIVINYISPLPGMAGLGNWNLAIGFALIVLGLIMAVRWR
ncbi:MAG: cell division protein CrgA [Mycobacteriales bacterium]